MQWWAGVGGGGGGGAPRSKQGQGAKIAATAAARGRPRGTGASRLQPSPKFAMPAATPRSPESLSRLHAQGQRLPDDALQLVFDRLPLGEQVFTVSAVSRAWRRRAQPKQQQLKERRRQLEEEGYELYAHYSDYSAYAVPLWLGQKAWPALTAEQSGHLVCRAARHGDVSALRWMLKQPRKQRQKFVLGLDPQSANISACDAAAAGGQLEALQLLLPLCGLSSGVCAAAAASGHLTVLQWLRAQDPPCPWGGHVCESAARSGQVAALQWLRAQDPPCPWSVGAC